MFSDSANSDVKNGFHKSYNGQSSFYSQFVVGAHADLESLFAVESFCSRFEFNPIISSQVGSSFDSLDSSSLNSGFKGVADSDCLVVIGSSFKKELPVFNSRLRSSFLRDNCSIFHFGSSTE